MGTATTTTTPESAVEALMKQVADENGLEITENLASVPSQTIGKFIFKVFFEYLGLLAMGFLSFFYGYYLALFCHFLGHLKLANENSLEITENLASMPSQTIIMSLFFLVFSKIFANLATIWHF